MSARTRERTVDLPTSLGGVDALPVLRDGPARPDWLLILGHGAGAPMTSAFMTAFTAAIAALDIGVVRFDFPYMVRAARDQKKKPPDRTAALEASWRAVIEATHRSERQPRTAIGGKSMGGRIATHVVSGDEPETVPEAVVLLGYPLHPPGRPETLRDQHLSTLRIPALFLQGDRDALARIDLIRSTVDALRPPTTLDVVADANHDFAVPKSTGRSRNDVIADIAARSAAWLRSLPSGTR